VKGEVMFPPEVERDAFRADNGEFGWTGAQIPMVVDVLLSRGMGILGGELWWVRDGSSDWFDSIPQKHGPPGVYPWETNRRPGEPWPHFVERGAADALAAVERWPAPEDLPPDLPGRILYNLTWVSEVEFTQLSSKAL
jgi:hypothetical protein